MAIILAMVPISITVLAIGLTLWAGATALEFLFPSSQDGDHPESSD